MADLICERTDLSDANERLWLALADQLKLPLTQIARRAELEDSKESAAESLLNIQQTAGLALKLIDSYALSVWARQTKLAFEPVSLAAMLRDTADELEPLAKRYGCRLRLAVARKCEPVMAHSQALSAAFLSLGQVFIEAGSGEAPGQNRVITLGSYRSKDGITVGVFGGGDQLTKGIYQRARLLYGRARQPFTTLTAASATGVFVADSLLGAMSAPLYVASHQKSKGLAANFLISHQLRLV